MKYIPYNQLSTHNEDKGRVKRESHRQVEEGVIRKMITEMVLWNTSANFFFFKSYVESQQQREGKIKMSRSRGGTGPLLSAMASPLSFWEECEGPLDLTAGEGHGLRKAGVGGKSLRLSFTTCLSPLSKNKNLPTVALSFHPACIPLPLQRGVAARHRTLFSSVQSEWRGCVQFLSDFLMCSESQTPPPQAHVFEHLVPIGWRYLGRWWNLQEIKPY